MVILGWMTGAHRGQPPSQGQMGLSCIIMLLLLKNEEENAGSLTE